MNLKENTLDYDTYVALRNSVNWINFSEIQTRKALENSLYNIVAEVDHKPVGMARLVGDGLYITIVDVVVSSQYQGRGIGKAMMEKLIQYVEDTTPPGGKVSLMLIAEKGKEAFYEKLGFKQIPHEFCGSGMKKVISNI